MLFSILLFIFIFRFYICFICTAVSGKFNSLIFIVVYITFNQPFGCECLSWPIHTRFSKYLTLCPDLTCHGRNQQALFFFCPKIRMKEKKQGWLLTILFLVTPHSFALLPLASGQSCIPLTPAKTAPSPMGFSHRCYVCTST